MDTFQKLAAPFSPVDIEWRIAQAGEKKDGTYWAKVLAYVTNRAIMNRLDEVLTPVAWKNEFVAGPQGGVVCGLSLKIEQEWITKWDGADNTDIESVKGGLSDAMKRAAVQWGIGRYLYNLDEGWAEIYEKATVGARYASCKIKLDGREKYIHFYWKPPELPGWARPKPEDKPEPEKAEPEKPKADAAKADSSMALKSVFNAVGQRAVKDGLLTKDEVKAVVTRHNGDYGVARNELDFLVLTVPLVRDKRVGQDSIDMMVAQNKGDFVAARKDVEDVLAELGKA